MHRAFFPFCLISKLLFSILYPMQVDFVVTVSKWLHTKGTLATVGALADGEDVSSVAGRDAAPAAESTGLWFVSTILHALRSKSNLSSIEFLLLPGFDHCFCTQDFNRDYCHLTHSPWFPFAEPSATNTSIKPMQKKETCQSPNTLQIACLVYLHTIFVKQKRNLWKRSSESRC